MNKLIVATVGGVMLVLVSRPLPLFADTSSTVPGTTIKYCSPKIPEGPNVVAEQASIVKLAQQMQEIENTLSSNQLHNPYRADEQDQLTIKSLTDQYNSLITKYDSCKLVTQ